MWWKKWGHAYNKYLYYHHHVHQFHYSYPHFNIFLEFDIGIFIVILRAIAFSVMVLQYFLLILPLSVFITLQKYIPSYERNLLKKRVWWKCFGWNITKIFFIDMEELNQSFWVCKNNKTVFSLSETNRWERSFRKQSAEMSCFSVENCA